MTQLEKDYVLNFLAYAGVTNPELSEKHYRFIFDSLTCKGQETMAADGIHGWDIHLCQDLEKYDYHTPAVDYYILKLAQECKLKVNMASRWPDGKLFAICLTHDVDSIREATCLDRLRCFPLFASQAGFKQTSILLLSAIKRGLTFWRNNNNFHFEKWIEVEKRFGFTSTFFFLPAPMSSPTWADNFYAYTDNIKIWNKNIKLFEFMKFLNKWGWDVGLHGGHYCALDIDICKNALNVIARAIGQSPIACRQHHLFFDVLKSPNVFEKSGLKLDSSLGSNKDTIFRTRTALPHFLFDRWQGKATKILEIPLVMQDFALFAQNSLALTGKAALIRAKISIDRIAEVQGTGAILWHPDYGADGDNFKVYEDLLEYIHEKNGWGCSMRELGEWWLRSDKV